MTNKMINQRGNVLLIILIVVAVVFAFVFIKNKTQPVVSMPNYQTINNSEDLNSAMTDLDGTSTSEIDSELNLLTSDSSSI